jgi:hypothetical protein
MRVALDTNIFTTNARLQVAASKHWLGALINDSAEEP